jgi:transcriptional regulator with XRE-family HTH domain
MRLKKGWTLEQAGRRAMVDPGNLSRYETGSMPTLVVLGRILMAYDMSLKELAELLEAGGEPTNGVPRRVAEIPDDPFVAAVAGALERLGFKRPSEEESG